MALTVSDFPLCCGAKCLTGFNRQVTKEEFERTLSEIPQKRAVFAILNKNQITELKDTAVIWLAESGFVLTDAWINGVHESQLFSFVRADKRIRLDINGTKWWKGAIQRPDLEGTLERFENPGRNETDYRSKQNRSFRGYPGIDLSKPLELEDGTPVTLTVGGQRDRVVGVEREAVFSVFPPLDPDATIEGRRNPFLGTPPGTRFYFLHSNGTYSGCPYERMAIRNVGMTEAVDNRGNRYTPTFDSWPPWEPPKQPWGQRYDYWPTF